MSTRSCTEVANGGKPCVGESRKTQTCNDIKCPVDGKWSKWSDWEECSKTCGGGTRSRSRNCEGPFFGGKDCNGEPTETENCGETPCPVDGIFLEWSVWSTCNKECGGGLQTRTRECQGPFFGGNDCDGAREEDQACNVVKCPIDGEWGQWSDWSDCSRTCAGGFSDRTRACKGPFYGGRDCDGDNTETKTCNESPCPINGKWNDWGAWTTCSKPCGTGERSRERTCDGPYNGGDDCDGNPTQYEDCNTTPCPIDGYWSDWGAWGECVDGKQYATRTCNDPKFGGEDCQGDREKVQNC